MKKILIAVVLMIAGAQAYSASEEAVERHQETIRESIRVMEIGLSRAVEAGDVSAENFLELRIEELKNELSDDFVAHLRSDDVPEEALNGYTMDMAKRTSIVKEKFAIQ